MKQFLTLFKINMLNELSSLFVGKNKKKNSSNSPLIFALLGFTFIFVVMFIYTFMFASTCHEANYDQAILSFGITIGSLFCIISTITRSYGILFQSKDFDLLVSMPIRPQYIVASKFTSLMLMNYIYFLMFYFPSIFFYGLFANPPFYFYLLAIIIFIFGPFFIASICGFIAFLIGSLTSKMRNKSIFTTILSIIFVLLIFGGSTYISNNIGKIESAEEMKVFVKQLETILQKIYFPTKFAVNGLLGNIGYFFIFLGISIIPLIVYIVFVGKLFIRVNTRSRKSFTQTNFKLKEQTKSSPILAMFKKEIKKFFGSATYCLNSLIGPILSVIISVTFIFTLFNNFEEDNFILSIVFIGTMCTMIGLFPTTACSISLEGKSIWLIKSSPIKTKDLFIAKLLLHIVICIPIIIIDGIIFAIFSPANILSKVLFFICLFVFAVLYSVEGLWTNTIAPKFNWDNEVQVIKQGTALISMLVSIGITIIIYVPSVVLSLFVPQLAILFVTIFGIIATIIFSLILFTNGKKRYESLDI